VTRPVTDTDIQLVIASITRYRSQIHQPCNIAALKRSDDIVQQQQLHECIQANMLSVGQTMQNGDNYLKPWTDVPPSLVVLRLVTNIVAAALTLMSTSTPMHTSMKVSAVGRQAAGWFLEAKGH